jgi:hypothetical protein
VKNYRLRWSIDPEKSHTLHLSTAIQQAMAVKLSNMRITNSIRFTAEQDGKTIQYTLTRSAIWRSSKMDSLSDGESYETEIKGKHMSIAGHRGGNQGKKETLKYDILDIRSVQ